MKSMSYEEAGVSIRKGDEFAEFIAGLKSPAVSRGIGGFAGGIELDLTGVEKPVMLSSTDGVGTKLLVARRVGKFDTLGIDLVAMCVNDLIVAGVRPQVFLDYIACGSLDGVPLKELISGVVAGCEDAQCILAGGETAEMPDIYREDDFDLAGFCSGVGEKSRLLPRKDEIADGDLLLALPSSGIHSNGLSLARKALKDASDEVWAELLTPTRIYVRDFAPFIEQGLVKAAAHITGGGLEGNIVRVLPKEASIELNWNWEIPGIFNEIQKAGPVEVDEMRRVFNMGLGLVMVVSPKDADAVRELAKSHNIDLVEAGSVTIG